MRRLPPDWAHEFATVDYERRLALVAERLTADAPELIGVARYEPSEESDTAEIALVVEDAWQGHGLGVTLLGDLLAAAEARGIRRFVAYVLGDNRRMLNLLARHADVRDRSVESGVVTLILRRKAGPEGRRVQSRSANPAVNRSDIPPVTASASDSLPSSPGNTREASWRGATQT